MDETKLHIGIDFKKSLQKINCEIMFMPPLLTGEFCDPFDFKPRIPFKTYEFA